MTILPYALTLFSSHSLRISLILTPSRAPLSVLPYSILLMTLLYIMIKSELLFTMNSTILPTWKLTYLTEVPSLQKCPPMILTSVILPLGIVSAQIICTRVVLCDQHIMLSELGYESYHCFLLSLCTCSRESHLMNSLMTHTVRSCSFSYKQTCGYAKNEFFFRNGILGWQLNCNLLRNMEPIETQENMLLDRCTLNIV